MWYLMWQFTITPFLTVLTKIHCFGTAFFALQVSIVRALSFSNLLGREVRAAIVSASTLLYAGYGLVPMPIIVFLIALLYTQYCQGTCIMLAPVSGSLAVLFCINPELASNFNVEHPGDIFEMLWMFGIWFAHLCVPHCRKSWAALSTALAI